MNQFYRKAMVRYLALLALACLIASWHVGQGVGVVWLVTAVALYLFGRAGAGGRR